MQHALCLGVQQHCRAAGRPLKDLVLPQACALPARQCKAWRGQQHMAVISVWQLDPDESAFEDSEVASCLGKTWPGEEEACLRWLQT